MAVNKKSSGLFEIRAHSLLGILAPIMFEWLLIFLLFTQAAFSYIITKFACYCKLQVPCLICSRLDHVFGHEKHGFYWDLICGTHKLEISSHVFCCFRDKLVDFHGPGDGCILSSAAINTSNADNYNKLVASCIESSHCSSYLEPLCIKNCPFFNDPCIMKDARPISLLKKRDEPEAIDTHLSPSNEISYKQDRFESKKGNLSGSCSSSKYINQRSDPLYHVGYTELKIASDTESDISTSDDNATATFCKESSSKEVVENNCVKLEHHSTSSVQGLIPIIEIDNEKHEKCLVMADTDLGEMGRYQIDSIEPVKTMTVSSLPTSLVDVHSDVDGVKANRNERSETTCTMETEVTGKAGSGPLIELAVETSSQMSSNLELGDAYNLVVRGEQQLSEIIPDQSDNKDSKVNGDDVKLLVSQISANRVNDPATLNDVSPRVSLDSSEELKSSDASGSQLQHRRVSLERNESGFESIDGSVISEIEGESLIDRLKRQVEHDTKSLKALYKELEEERNASAVAASQAMAMITRLQEEKASLHMEALQYLREMEEQAEYDTDALQNANDLLVEKEKEVQDLDEEFRSYRMKFPNSAAPGSEPEPISDHNECHQVVETDQNSLDCGGNTTRETTNPLSVLEEEKKYIAESLQKLKMKILQLSGSGICSVGTTGACYENETREKNDSKHVNIMDLDGNGVNEDILSHSEGDGVNEVDGSTTIHGGYVSHSYNGLHGAENNCSCDIVQCGSVISENSDLSSLGVEVSVLIEKISTLDENINFLSDVIRSFVNQEEGIHFVREIICFLQELKIRAKKTE